ncbi:MAG: hypothetical protein BECKG1743D_GA0114223_104652 [Candidatus Kentron sp. G]|nr:MAG: hypothetical protein BECKG1743F_GA0114225_104331 [Candidatus Kentron sp. G]VFN02139.1 MAG: hypothetical protein BECKG1743E_GA0114224_104761 [Candidatus Kentron sp. G]VFN03372.1 MAG: hypothetical protein BECKG1743D_GA0114223_104652 [Candidatus Kentron sp. G]
MENLSGKTIIEAKTLPGSVQNETGSVLPSIIDEDDDEREWDILVSSPASQQRLCRDAIAVRKAIREGRTLDFDPADII